MLWTYDTSVDGPGAQFHGDPLVVGDLVVVGTDAKPQGFVYAFEQKSGTLRWKRAFSGGVPSRLIHREGLVYAVAVSGTVEALDAEGGQVRWTFTDSPEGSAERSHPAPLLIGNRLFVAWRQGFVDAIDTADGRLVWRTRFDSFLNTSLARFGQAIVVGTIDGWVYSVRVEDGQRLGRSRLGVMTHGDPVAWDDCVVFFWSTERSGSGNRHAVGCVDPSTWEVLWSLTSPSEWTTFHPLLQQDRLVVGSKGRVIAIDAGTGTERWSCPVDGVPRGLAYSEGRLFVGTLSGRVAALDVESCRAGDPAPGSRTAAPER